MNRLIHSMPMPEGLRLRLRRRFLKSDDELDYLLLQEDEASFHSRQLLRRARELRLPVPPIFEGQKLTSDYERSGLDGHRYFLSMIGEQKVRYAIREEEKYQYELRARRIPYITALTGLIGAVTGLVALLSKL